MAQSATDLIRNDHRQVEQLYQQYQAGTGHTQQRHALIEQICHALEIHAQLEEGIFYPAVQAKLGSTGKDLVSEALKEHGEMKRLISVLQTHDMTDTQCAQTMQQLMQGVQHHVQEEENEMLPQAEQHLGGAIVQLGHEMEQKKQQLMTATRPQGQAGEGTLAQRMTATDQESGENSNVAQSIDVEVPVHTAYNQWTQFEEFPRFMDGVENVQQLDDTHLRWTATIGGKTKEWDAVITEQIPDERIAWTNTTGARNAGVVTFHRLADNRTRVMLQVDYEPEGIIENVGDKLGVVSRRIHGDLRRFKDFIEARGQETGAWRGEVTHAQP
jgi:uncharacterized membrane protein